MPDIEGQTELYCNRAAQDWAAGLVLSYLFTDNRNLSLTSAPAFRDWFLSQSDLLGLPLDAPDTFEVTSLNAAVNHVMRVSLSYGGKPHSFVVKQVPQGGRLEKFPSVVFPETRLQFEKLWIDEYKRNQIDSKIRPAKVYLLDEPAKTLILEDFGERPAYAAFLQKCDRHQLEVSLEMLGGFLGQFHARTTSLVAVNNPSAALNRSLVFTHPITKHDLIRCVWESQKSNTSDELWQQRIYLQEWFLTNHREKALNVLEKLERDFKTGKFNVLTHGDLHCAGLLMLADGGMGVTDSEFADTGCLAFDLGTLAAHVWALRLASGDAHVDLVHYIGLLWHAYWIAFLKEQRMQVETFEELIDLTLKHAGSELLRCVLGARYFPYAIPISFGQPLLEDALCFLLESHELAVHLLTQSLPVNVESH
jgi:hypothetical protein